MFKLIAKDGKARYGKLKTKSSTVETPCFLPVATKAAVKHATSDDLVNMNAQAIICNSLILALTYGYKELAKKGGIHKFMNFNKTIFTDSGGFQMIRKTFHIKTLESGVYFKDMFNNRNILVKPEDVVEIQEDIGSDVAMVLDDHNDSSKSKKYHALAVDRTFEWAKRCLEAKKDKKQQMWGIVQGGTYLNLRKKSAELITSLDFDGFALGGLAIGEPPEVMHKIINSTVDYLPEDKPRYVMGLGEPAQLLRAISEGIDFFDSTYPTQNARHSTMFTRKGKIDLEKAKYKDDDNPIDKECDCYVCKNYSRSYVHYLCRMNEPIALRYKTFHNLRFMHKLLEDARLAIKEKRFDKFRKKFEKGW